MVDQEREQPGIRCEHCGRTHPADLSRCPVTQRILQPSRFFPPGTLIDGKYRLAGTLGAGTMGVVMEGTHELLNKRVALKLILPDAVGDEASLARLVREARAASGIRHPNVCEVSDLGVTNEGTAYLVMEYLDGQTLASLQARKKRLECDVAIGVLCQVLDGLSAVHAKAVVHRDLKPENVMIVGASETAPTGTVKLLDFGISKILDEENNLRLTRTGVVLGTPRYMAPEQVRGDAVDQRTDLYAAGTMLYRLIAGRPPYHAKSYEALVAQVVAGGPKPPSHYVPSVPAELDAVILRAMAVVPDDRYGTAQSFKEALLPLLSGASSEDSTDDLDETLMDAGLSGTVQTAVEPLRGASRPSGPAMPEITSSALMPLNGVGEPAEEATSRVSSDFTAPDLGTGASLELMPIAQEVTDRPDWVGQPAPAGAARHEPASGGRWMGKFALVVLLVALASAGWFYRHRLASIIGGEGRPASVLVLIETTPKQARIWVDGVSQVSNSVRLPRGEQMYRIRVEATGYVSKELSVGAEKTRVLRVKLRRRGR